MSKRVPVMLLIVLFGVLPALADQSAHVVVSPECDRDLVRRRIELLLHERFGIDHTTLQMEEQAPDALLRVENAPPRGRSQRGLQG